jgi:hypothetical protein
VGAVGMAAGFVDEGGDAAGHVGVVGAVLSGLEEEVADPLTVTLALGDVDGIVGEPDAGEDLLGEQGDAGVEVEPAGVEGGAQDRDGAGEFGGGYVYDGGVAAAVGAGMGEDLHFEGLAFGVEAVRERAEDPGSLARTDVEIEAGEGLAGGGLVALAEDEAGEDAGENDRDIDGDGAAGCEIGVGEAGAREEGADGAEVEIDEVGVPVADGPAGDGAAAGDEVGEALEEGGVHDGEVEGAEGSEVPVAGEAAGIDADVGEVGAVGEVRGGGGDGGDTSAAAADLRLKIYHVRSPKSSKGSA